MKFGLINTKNYIKMSEAIASLRAMPESVDRIGLVYGDFGLGKTNSIERILASNEEGIYLRANQSWTKATVLNKLSNELKTSTDGTASERYENIVKELQRKEKIFIMVDEVDTCLRSEKYSVLELFRDIHDESRCVVVFIGMRQALAKFKKHGHFHSRITKVVEFLPIVKEDIEKFCTLSEVKIEDELIAYFYEKYRNLRQIKSLLVRLEDYAELNEIESVGLKELQSSGAEDDYRH